MNISCRIANADTQCGRITNPPERESLQPYHSKYSNKMRIILTFILCLKSFIVCEAQSPNYILDKVICDLYNVYCKEEGVSRGDTMFLNLDIYDWKTEKDRTREDYKEIIKRLSIRYKDFPIQFERPCYPCTVYSIPYPLDEYVGRNRFSIKIKDTGFYPDKKLLVIGGIHLFYYRWKKGRLIMIKHKEYGI